jgi:hypothetical protein
LYKNKQSILNTLKVLYFKRKKVTSDFASAFSGVANGTVDLGGLHIDFHVCIKLSEISFETALAGYPQTSKFLKQGIPDLIDLMIFK